MQPLHLMNKKQNTHTINFQKEQFSLTRSAEYSTLHPIPKAPEIRSEGINDIHYKKYQHLLHLHSWDSNNVTKKITVLFSILISTVIRPSLKPGPNRRAGLNS